MKPKTLLSLLPLILLALGLAACAPQAASPVGANIALTLEPNPPVAGPGHLTVTLTGADGQPIEGADVTVEGTMGHDGMQPMRAKLKGGAGGQYEAPFMWTMAGDWTLTVVATLPGGQTARREFPVTVQEAMDMGGHGDEHAPHRVPNEGAVIRLVSPTEGAVFHAGDEIRIQIETENFTLGEEGNHWHFYVDGESPQMVMGGMNEAILRDLAPGTHEISVFLSRGDHADLEEGDSVTIIVAK